MNILHWRSTATLLDELLRHFQFYYVIPLSHFQFCDQIFFGQNYFFPHLLFTSERCRKSELKGISPNLSSGQLLVGIFVGTFFLLFLFTNKWCRKSELKGIHPLTSFLLGSRQTFHLEHSMEMMGRAGKWSFFRSDGIQCFFFVGRPWHQFFLMVLPALNYHHWMFFDDIRYLCVRYLLTLSEIFVIFVWYICSLS